MYTLNNVDSKVLKSYPNEKSLWKILLLSKLTIEYTSTTLSSKSTSFVKVALL